MIASQSSFGGDVPESLKSETRCNLWIFYNLTKIFFKSILRQFVSFVSLA